MALSKNSTILATDVAPKSHATAYTTYGVATSGMYGHVKLSDYANEDNGTSQGIAVTPLALYNVAAKKQNKLDYTPVKSVNGVNADAEGDVALDLTPSTVKGVIGSAVASNDTSLTLPSGGMWFVFNPLGAGSVGAGTGSATEYGVSTNSALDSSGYVPHGTTYSGGTTVYAKCVDWDGGTIKYSLSTKLVAVRIS